MPVQIKRNKRKQENIFFQASRKRFVSVGNNFKSHASQRLVILVPTSFDIFLESISNLCYIFQSSLIPLRDGGAQVHKM